MIRYSNLDWRLGSRLTAVENVFSNNRLLLVIAVIITKEKLSQARATSSLDLCLSVRLSKTVVSPDTISWPTDWLICCVATTLSGPDRDTNYFATLHLTAQFYPNLLLYLKLCPVHLATSVFVQIAPLFKSFVLQQSFPAETFFSSRAKYLQIEPIDGRQSQVVMLATLKALFASLHFTPFLLLSSLRWWSKLTLVSGAFARLSCYTTLICLLQAYFT